jgi:hypothetical protein
VPVEAIAEDLLGLYVEEVDLDGVSGLLYPAERLIQVNSNDAPTRRRFTLAHEVDHWVCQVQEGRGAPLMCRAEDIAPDADRRLEREANVFAAELLMPEPDVRAAVDDPAASDRFGRIGRSHALAAVQLRPRGTSGLNAATGVHATSLDVEREREVISAVRGRLPRDPISAVTIRLTVGESQKGVRFRTAEVAVVH